MSNSNGVDVLVAAVMSSLGTGAIAFAAFKYHVDKQIEANSTVKNLITKVNALEETYKTLVTVELNSIIIKLNNIEFILSEMRKKE